MIIANTTFVVPENRYGEFVEWGNTVYLDSIRKAGIFSGETMAKVLTFIEPGTVSVAIQARAESLDEAQRWFDETASALHGALHQRFNQQLLFFTTFMEVL